MTVNRVPQSVNIPSASQVANRYFNQLEWKGICEDKNFLATDQQTFEDAVNVYVNDDGILRSRPKLVKDNDLLEEGLTDISKVYSFSNILVYIYKVGAAYKVAIKYRGVLYSPNNTYNTDKITPTVADNKIFFFGENIFDYFDTLAPEQGIREASDFLYSPLQTELGEVASESKNFLTTAHRFLYTYISGSTIPPSLYGETAYFTVDGIKYQFEVNQYSNLVVLQKANTLASTNNLTYFFRSENWYAKYDRSRKVCAFSYRSTGYNSYFEVPPAAGNIIYKPYISDDEDMLVVCCENGVYYIRLDLELEYILQGVYREVLDIYPFNLTVDTSNVAIIAKNVNTYAEIKYYWITGGDDYLKVRFMKNGAYTSVTATSSFGDYPNSTYYIESLIFDVGNEIVFGAIRSDAKQVIAIKAQRTSGSSVQASAFSESLTYAQDLSVAQAIEQDAYTLLVEYYTATDVVLLRETTTVTAFTSGTVKTFSREMTVTDFANRTNLNYYNGDVSVIGGVFHIATETFVHSVVPNLIIYSLRYGVDAYTDDGYYIKLYDNSISTVNIYKDYDGEINYISPKKIVSSGTYYFAIGNTVYWTDNRIIEGQFKWYLNDYYIFPDIVTSIELIGDNTLAVFLENEIWYLYKSEDHYYTSKSKMAVGCADGNDTLSTYDGTAVMFTCERGFVAMSYQQLVNSDDQTLTYLSDNIFSLYKDFYHNNNIKLYRYDYWIYLYSESDATMLLFDTRNASWWKLDFGNNINQLYGIEKVYMIKEGSPYICDTSDDDYYDDGMKKIEWHLTSQKLHFSAINNDKHISGITFTTSLDETPDKSERKCSCKITYRLFRKLYTDTSVKQFSYPVTLARTFVQKLNYFKVTEFQYNLSYDSEVYDVAPLSLCSIAVKYKIGGQVR